MSIRASNILALELLRFVCGNMKLFFTRLSRPVHEWAGCPIHSRSLRMSGRGVLLSSLNFSTGRTFIFTGHS
jgi:hypothetical protein